MALKTQIVSYRLDKLTFELICKQDMAFTYRENQAMGLDKVLVSDTIYSDAKQGHEAAQSDIKLLGDDPIKKILLHGHVALSTEERRRRVEERTQQIVGYIHANYLDTTGKPLPRERVVSAISQLKGLQIDPFAELQNQVADILKKLEKSNLLNVQSGGIEGTLVCKYDQLSKVQGVLKKYQVSIISDNYGSEVKLVISISPGCLDEVMRQLEKECRGNFDFKVAGQQTPAGPAPDAGKKGKKGAKKGQ